MHAISTEIFPWNLEKYDNNQNVLPVAFYSWNHWYFADGPKACLVLQLTDWSLSQAAADACFAECNCTRQRRLCTRQSLCRVLHSAYPFTAKAYLPSAACRALGKGFPECHDGTRQRISRVPRSAKKYVFYFFKKMLCRVPAYGTQQSLFSFLFLDFLCRVL